MKNRIFTLPNIITLGNLACGCAAVVFAMNGDLDRAFWLVVVAAVCDFADGMAARLTGQYSPLGIQLDSLADVVSFGVAPSTMMFSAWDLSPALWIDASSPLYDVLGWGVFAVALFSAVRLARFNVEAQKPTHGSSFTGLPTPASALAVAALIRMWFDGSWPLPGREILLVLTAAVSYLMICPLKMFSLKFKNLGWHGNESRYIFIAASGVLVALFRIGGIPLAVGLYLVMSTFRLKID